ncbi:MAG: hypothetical protein WBP95_12405, partial [Acidobacteriaceae bacterium]
TGPLSPATAARCILLRRRAAWKAGCPSPSEPVFTTGFLKIVARETPVYARISMILPCYIEEGAADFCSFRGAFPPGRPSVDA